MLIQNIPKLKHPQQHKIKDYRYYVYLLIFHDIFNFQQQTHEQANKFPSNIKSIEFIQHSNVWKGNIFIMYHEILVIIM